MGSKRAMTKVFPIDALKISRVFMMTGRVIYASRDGSTAANDGCSALCDKVTITRLLSHHYLN